MNVKPRGLATPGLRRKREMKCWTRQELGERVGLSKAMIGLCETGKARMGLLNIRRCANVLGCRVTDITGM
jgi:transcriptional regulator with XRE-family HTH domain